MTGRLVTLNFELLQALHQRRPSASEMPWIAAFVTLSLTGLEQQTDVSIMSQRCVACDD